MSSKVAQLRPTLHQRVGDLERKAEVHAAMAPQVAEMYAAFDLARRIGGGLNRLSIKIGAGVVGLTGAIAAVLTIIDKVRVLFH